MAESQNVEYKQNWRDEYLKWFSGFANAQGGKIFIGIDDKGNVTGLDDYKKLMDDIPNKAVNHLGLVVDVNLHQKDNRQFIEIVIPPSTVPISYHGIYHYRSGSTKQELKGNALMEFILRKMGRSWDEIPMENVSLTEIDQPAVDKFLRKAISKGRIYADADSNNLNVLLKNLRLMNEDGKINAAAMLLFGKDPSKYFAHSYFKIGKFGNSDSDLRFQDLIEGNIFEIPDKVIRLLRERYLISPIHYQGIERIEELEYPEAALREAILNSVVHKDYTDTSIQMSIYDDKIILWNPGNMPVDLPIEKITEKHSSKPRNKYIADIFFKAGYIESWGRGIETIMNSLKAAGLPEPEFRQQWGGISVTFRKDIYTEEQLKKYDVNDRQIKALLYIKQNGQITNSEYQKINNLKQTVSSQELQDLVKKQFLIRIGSTGRSSKYKLTR